MDLEQGLPDKLLTEPNLPPEGRLAEMLNDLRRLGTLRTDGGDHPHPTTSSDAKPGSGLSSFGKLAASCDPS